MKYSNYYFRILLCILFSLMLFSCATNNTAGIVEIPFTLKNNRILLEAIINGKRGRFIFDTGTTESYFDIDAANLLPVSYTRTSYEGRPVTALIYALNRITLGGGTELKPRSWLIIRSDILDNVKKEGYDGILGTGIFKGYWCELSFSKSKIILHTEKPEYFTSHIPSLILNRYNADFHIPLAIDDQIFYFNLDTGVHDGIYFPGGITRFKIADEYRIILSDEEVSQYYLVKTGSVHILDETYRNVSVMTNSFLAKRWGDDSYNDIGLLGIAFLKYYDFLFDFRELHKGKTTGLYYEPNTPAEERDYGFFSFIKAPPEFGVLNFGETNGGIFIRSVLQDSGAYAVFGLRPGTVVTKINGVPVDDLPRDRLFDRAIENITALEEGRERTIAVPPISAF
jgi:hypothetical protein